MSLFRKEVQEAKRGEWLGAILVAAPLSRWVIGVFMVTLAMAILSFLFFGHYTRREAVSGQLVPMAGLITIVAPSAGTLIEVRVREGQSVVTGEILLELSSEQDSAALGNAHAIVCEQLQVQRSKLQSDLMDQQALAQQQEGASRSKISLLRSQLIQVGDQLAIQQEQVDSSQQLLDRISPLRDKGYVSAVQIQQQQAAVLDAKAQLKSLTRQKLDIQQQLGGAQQALSQLPLDTAGKRNDTERQLSSVSQSLAQNEMQRAIVLRAPRAGVVSSVLLKEGQMAGTGQSILSILPSNSALQAQLLVPSRAIGFIEPGNTVVLRYQAFPYQKFGQHYGRIVEISRSALSPSEASVIVGKQVDQAFYRVMVDLDNQHVLAYGHFESVKPGMALDADILMERRRLIEWVFEPLYGIRHRLEGRPSHG
jgi:membrane fusion protein